MKNKTEIMKSVNGVASKTVMKLKKHSPEILVVAGIAFGSTAEECLYDAFDCPMCGCQVIAKERKRDYIPFISTDEEDADDDQI